MRASTTLSILGAAFVSLATSTADAHVHGHRHTAFGTAGRVVIVGNRHGSLLAVGSHHRSRRFFLSGSHHHRTGHFDRFAERGFVGGFAGGGFTEIPAGVVSTDPVAASASAAPVRRTVELPPCREVTPAGVVINRGRACMGSRG